MDLTAERFAKLILSINPRRMTERSRENRGEQRGGVRYRIMIKVPGPPRPSVHRAWLRDFSNMGFGMASSVPLTSGQAFAIQMQSALGVIEIHCSAAHCQRVAEDVYAIGARFAERWYTRFAA